MPMASPRAAIPKAVDMAISKNLDRLDIDLSSVAKIDHHRNKSSDPKDNSQNDEPQDDKSGIIGEHHLASRSGFFLYLPQRHFTKAHRKRSAARADQRRFATLRGSHVCRTPVLKSGRWVLREAALRAQMRVSRVCAGSMMASSHRRAAA